MAYVAPSIQATGDLITAAIWNQNVVNNMVAVATPQLTLANPASPTGTTSVTPVMMGLGSGITIAFAVTGRVVVHFTAGWSSSSGASQNFAQLQVGTGTAPANGAAVTGTQISAQKQLASTSAGAASDLAIVGGTTGLTLNTAYWVDIAIATNAGTMTLSNVNVVAGER